MRFIRRRSSFSSKSLAVIGACASLLTPTVASAAQCGYWVDEAAYIANGQRGDILLTRVEGSPAGAVTDPLGQFYTHTGILLNPYQVRHNTSSIATSDQDFLIKASAALVASHFPAACYEFARPPEMRQGKPGLATNSIGELPGIVAWNTNQLYLMKPKDEGAFRVGASASAGWSEAITGQLYDVRAYVDYNTGIGQNRSMCSGSIKHATDLSGYGGFNLVTYSQEQVTRSALSLFDYVYRRVTLQVDKEFKVLGFSTLNPICRDFIAAGAANHVVSCFSDGKCDRGIVPQSKTQSISRWANAQLGTAVSISPDNLVHNQPNSLYGTVVPADYRPKTQRYYSYQCELGTACQSGTYGQCPNGSTRYCYNGDWTPCPN